VIPNNIPSPGEEPKDIFYDYDDQVFYSMEEIKEEDTGFFSTLWNGIKSKLSYVQ